MRANKKDFELKHNGIPIYSKSFNPTNATVLNAGTGVFTIPDHFFETNEELIYTPTSTFIGVAATAMQTSPGTDLPTSVFAKRIDQNQFQLSATKNGAALTFVSLGVKNQT